MHRSEWSRTPSFFYKEGRNFFCPCALRRGGMRMSVNDTLQLCLVLIAVISLCYQIFKK